MTHVTCRLTTKNRDQLRNPTLGNRVWATFTFFSFGYMLANRQTYRETDRRTYHKTPLPLVAYQERSRTRCLASVCVCVCDCDVDGRLSRELQLGEVRRAGRRLSDHVRLPAQPVNPSVGRQPPRRRERRRRRGGTAETQRNPARWSRRRAAPVAIRLITKPI